MSVTAAAIVLGALVVLLIKTRAVRALGATICIVFGVTLAASPIGPVVGTVLADAGTWAYAQLRTV